jgi:hypothetical protein
MASDSDTYLGIYLNDHLAGATAGLELAKRVLQATEGTDLGTFMRRLVDEIEEDRETLRDVMAEVDAGEDRLKVAGGWIAEKLGRLKLNGEILGESPLSRVVELESLSLGVEGKRVMWVALLHTRPERFGAHRLQELIARAERQRDGLEEHRRQAAGAALAG